MVLPTRSQNHVPILHDTNGKKDSRGHKIDKDIKTQTDDMVFFRWRLNGMVYLSTIEQKLPLLTFIGNDKVVKV
ncbi:LOW QUALITY PROTEIN: hypothetical protein ACHAWO_008711 [Cyclotella atomus]|uniref:Uncharacterized protein n=1 Tax=Cyclotella atomus TaxID=382360 RepID=A0ABD3NAV1_9STRA